MSQIVDSAPTRDPAGRDREERDDRQEPFARPTRLWVLLEALGYAGAFIDPSGVLAAQRFRRAEQQQERRHGR
jgi:hypothetical protein